MTLQELASWPAAQQPHRDYSSGACSQGCSPPAMWQVWHASSFPLCNAHDRPVQCLSGTQARTVSVSGPSQGGCGILVLIAARPAVQLEVVLAALCSLHQPTRPVWLWMGKHFAACSKIAIVALSCSRCTCHNDGYMMARACHSVLTDSSQRRADNAGQPAAGTTHVQRRLWRRVFACSGNNRCMRQLDGRVSVRKALLLPLPPLLPAMSNLEAQCALF